MKKKKRLSPYLVKQRRKWFYEIWKKAKGELTMSELADLLNLPLDRLWKILKEEDEVHAKLKS